MKTCYRIGGAATKEIFYYPDNELTPISISDTGPAAPPVSWSGRDLSLGEALDPQWREAFRDAKAEWFLPYISRMAKGEKVVLAEILEGYLKIHGKALLTVQEQLRRDGGGRM